MRDEATTTNAWMILRKLGLWPVWRICMEDLHYGSVILLVAGPGYPERFERYDLGRNVGSDEFEREMRPLRPCSTEWRHRLQLWATGEHRPTHTAQTWAEIRALPWGGSDAG